MFKKIVTMITAINSREDFDIVCGEIENAFQREKINWNDRTLLFDLISKIAISD